MALDTANRNTRKDTSLVGRLKLRKAERRKTDLHNKKYRIISRIIVIIFIILATFSAKTMIIEFLSIKKPLLNAKPKLIVVNEEAGF